MMLHGRLLSPLLGVVIFVLCIVSSCVNLARSSKTFGSSKNLVEQHASK